jgi:hypothetical protein
MTVLYTESTTWRTPFFIPSCDGPTGRISSSLTDAMPPPFKGAQTGMTNPESPTARELARQLLERETASATEVADFGAAMQRACAGVSETLRRSVGDDGYSALLARALVRAEVAQPVLTSIRRNGAGGIHLDVVAAVEDHGPVVVGAALESLLAALVDILSDLIGADMVCSLLEHDIGLGTTDARRRQ